MRKTKTIVIALLCLVAFLAACSETKPAVNETPLFNDTLNRNLDNLTKPVETTFEPFIINVTNRTDARYEIARDDVISLMGRRNISSDEIAFLGIKLGDPESKINETLGQADKIYGAKDQSYMNYEYRHGIGIDDKMSGITYHAENGTITQISIRNSLNKYLSGNTTIGTSKDAIYSLLDTPDYQDFTTTQRVFHYVERGLAVYFKQNYVEVYSFYMPKEFKGVVYKSVVTRDPSGIVTNITKPFLIE